MVIDQLGKNIPLPATPLRIVSLVPSQTELLYDLGLDKEVVGITKFCIHPEEWFRTKIRIGGTKKVNIAKIRTLAPNLVIANKEENNPEDISAIESFCPVWTSDISTLGQALDMIERIGELTFSKNRARELALKISLEFSRLSFPAIYRCAYMIWKDPWMVAGGNTFINDMMEACGLQNAWKDEQRYPTIELPELQYRSIQILFLSSEPYPFKFSDLNELTKILPEVKIVLVDGELFSWYGSRMQYSPAYFKELRNVF
jgi:ABC-type Fe3+-hydroxamate transport system substrate-binding protein